MHLGGQHQAFFRQTVFEPLQPILIAGDHLRLIAGGEIRQRVGKPRVFKPIPRHRLDKPLPHPEIIGGLIARRPLHQRALRCPEPGLGDQALGILGGIQHPCQRQRREVAHLAQIQPAKTGIALRGQLFGIHLAMAGHPGLAPDRCRHRLRPLAKMQPRNAVALARHHLRLVHHLGEIFLIDGDPQKRVHLHPAAGVILPIVALIQRADKGEGAVILDRAGDHIDAMLVLFPADRFFIGAGVGRHAQERLLAELEAPLQHIDHIPVWMLMHLIGERTMRARARLRLFSRERLELALVAAAPPVGHLPDGVFPLLLHRPLQHR